MELLFRRGNLHRNAGTLDRFLGIGRNEFTSLHLFGVGRSGSHAGYGIRAANSKDRRTDSSKGYFFFIMGGGLRFGRVSSMSNL